MPVQYPAGTIAAHMHTREKAGLFDVSHMLGVKFTGKDRSRFMEAVVSGDILGLPDGMCRLSTLTNEQGGIIDDCVVTNGGDHLYIVINAGHEEKDLPHLQKYMDHFDGEVSMQVMSGRGILALQGPNAISVFERHTNTDMSTVKFMTGMNMKVAGFDCFVTRSGYTGEDGVEISVPAEGTVDLFKKLLEEPEVEAVGLGARDSLRLEAGLCLYGNDLDDTTSPIEGTLLWTIAKHRREEGGFVGADVICAQIKNGVSRKRIGFVSKGAPVREGSKIICPEGEEIGVVTSGIFSPSLQKPIGMGYVKFGYHKAGTELQVQVRKKTQPLTVSKMPFVPPNYAR